MDSLDSQQVSSNRPPIIVVSGLPRSGTSMTMRMLEAGGVPIFTDRTRTPDEDNPRGYYELERVKRLAKETDLSWLAEAEGRAVKIISHLLTYLPASYRYKVIFMNRSLWEVVVSQNRMLEKRGGPADPAEDAKIVALFEDHLRNVKRWLEEQNHLEVVFLNYPDVIREPESESKRIAAFLGLDLDCRLMAAAVEQQLYRNRIPDKPRD